MNPFATTNTPRTGPPDGFLGMIRLHYNSVTRVLWVRLMPEEIHACHQLWVRNENYNWMVSGQLTLEELKKLRTKVGMRKSVTELASTKGTTC